MIIFYTSRVDKISCKWKGFNHERITKVKLNIFLAQIDRIFRSSLFFHSLTLHLIFGRISTNNGHHCCSQQLEYFLIKKVQGLKLWNWLELVMKLKRIIIPMIKNRKRIKICLSFQLFQEIPFFCIKWSLWWVNFMKVSSKKEVTMFDFVELKDVPPTKKSILVDNQALKYLYLDNLLESNDTQICHCYNRRW